MIAAVPFSLGSSRTAASQCYVQGRPPGSPAPGHAVNPSMGAARKHPCFLASLRGLPGGRPHTWSCAVGNGRHAWRVPTRRPTPRSGSAFPLATGQLSKGRPGSVCGGIGAMDGVRLAPMDGFTATPQTGTGRPKPGNRCACGCSPESNSSRAGPGSTRVHATPGSGVQAIRRSGMQAIRGNPEIRRPRRSGSSRRCRRCRSSRSDSWPGTAGGNPRRSSTPAPGTRSRW